MKRIGIHRIEYLINAYSTLLGINSPLVQKNISVFKLDMEVYATIAPYKKGDVRLPID